MGAKSRNKGARGEREVARFLTEWSGWQFKRKVRQHKNDYDIECVNNYWRYAVEVKNVANMSLDQLFMPSSPIHQYIDQAVSQALELDLYWMLFVKIPRKFWIIMTSHLPEDIDPYPYDEIIYNNTIHIIPDWAFKLIDPEPFFEPEDAIDDF